MVLFDGQTINLNGENELTNISFSKSDFLLSNFESNTTTYKKTQEISSSKLLKCIYSYYKLKTKEFTKVTKNIENCNVKNIKNILKEFYKRYIIPFYIPILTLTSLILIISTKENHNYQKIKIITFFMGLFTIIFSETTIRLVSENILQNIILLIFPLIFLITLYLFFFLKFKFFNLRTS